MTPMANISMAMGGGPSRRLSKSGTNQLKNIESYKRKNKTLEEGQNFSIIFQLTNLIEKMHLQARIEEYEQQTEELKTQMTKMRQDSDQVTDFTTRASSHEQTEQELRAEISQLRASMTQNQKIHEQNEEDENKRVFGFHLLSPSQHRFALFVMSATN